MPTATENIKGLNFITPIRKSEIPARENNRQSAIQKLPIWKEIVSVVDQTAASGIAPFESAAEIDLTPFKEQLKEFKNPSLTFLIKIRTLLRKYKVANRLEVIRRSDKVFLVGLQ